MSDGYPTAAQKEALRLQAVGYVWVMGAVATACVIAALALVAYHRL